MTTEQTGRQTIDTTDSIELLVSPAGGDPTPLPETRAADGTRSKLKAAPPPIPSRTSSQTIVPPRPRASTQTIPPPIPTRTSAQMPAVAGASAKAPPLPTHVRAKGTVPPLRTASADPDGWVVDAAPTSEASADSLAAQIDSLAPAQGDAPVAAPSVVAEPSTSIVVEPKVRGEERTKDAADGEDLRDIMDEDPEGPDATHATPFAVVDEGPSKEWLAKIDSVLRPETSAPVAFNNQPALFTTKAAATMFAAEPPQNTQPLELVDLEPAEPPKVNLPALPTASVAPAATLPPLPTAALPPLPTATLPPVQVAPKATLPPPAQVVAPAPSLAIAPQAKVTPLNTRRAPIATPGGYPVVDPDLDSSTDQDAGSFDIDVDVNPDLTSAHTTNFEMPVPHRFISQRAAIAIFAGAAVLTVAYLATRGGSQKKPARTAAAETAPAETTPAPTPAPVTQPVAAPAQQVAAPAQTAPAETAPAPTAPAPTQQVAAAVPAPAEQPAAPAGMIQIPVSSKPSGALVSFVDGGHAVVIGRTPTTIFVDPSQPHDIALTLHDHETQLATIPAGGMTALAVDMGPEKAGAMKAAPQQVAAVAPRKETASPTAAKHEAPKHEAPAREPKTQHITQPAPRAETPAAPSGSGVLMISSKPPCEIVVDGKSTHLMTPQRSIPLAPGTHTIMLVNAGAKIHKSLEIAITAKKPTKVIQDFTRH